MAHKQQALREMALFAGAGGGILGGKILGWECVCAVEWEPYPAAVLAARQNEGVLPPFPIWDDVQTFDGRPWRGLVDVVSGGFPCQDISAAGKGAGITGDRSGMWKHMARIVGEVRPRYVLVENSPVLTSRGLDVVLGDLAGMGYDAEWGVLGADDAGAPHARKRIWILAADPCEIGKHGNGTQAFPWQPGLPWREYRGSYEDMRGRPSIPPPIFRGTPDGVAGWVDSLAAVGNGQVPAVVRLAWHTLHERLSKRVGNGA